MGNISKSDRLKASGFFKTFYTWPVNDEWMQELYNYVICGFPPGSFHSACFANDMAGAARNTHPANDWRSIVEMMKWLVACAPADSFGTWTHVESWLQLTNDERNKILLDSGYIITDEEVTFRMLEEA